MNLTSRWALRASTLLAISTIALSPSLPAADAAPGPSASDSVSAQESSDPIEFGVVAGADEGPSSMSWGDAVATGMISDATEGGSESLLPEEAGWATAGSTDSFERGWSEEGEVADSLVEADVNDAATNSDASTGTYAALPSCPKSGSTMGAYIAFDKGGVRVRRGCHVGKHPFGWRKFFYMHGRTLNAVRNSVERAYARENSGPVTVVYQSAVNKWKCYRIVGCFRVDRIGVRTVVVKANKWYLPDHYQLGVITSYCQNDPRPDGSIPKVCPWWAKNPGPHH